MSTNTKSVLYVRLPCWKIYPGGVVYVADYIHKHRPDVHQEILDMSLIAAPLRKQALTERIQQLQPDIVAFSWRNMQTFGPHPENDALDVVMNYDYSPNVLARAKAVKDAVAIIHDYASARINNFRFMRIVRRLLPDSRIVVGGTAVSIFAKYIVEKCPNDSLVVVGEGEDAMLSAVNGFTEPAGDYYYKDSNGAITQGRRQIQFDLPQLKAVDFEYIETIFPEFHSYLDDYIGVQTKRGCPYQCHFCLYNKIEGHRQRYRDPAEIAKEVEILNKHYGAQKIWFTDAQFCSTLRSTKHVDKIMDELLARKTDIQWSAYLRLNHLTPAVAKKMLATGLCSIDLSFTGSQDVIDNLTLGYKLNQQMDAFKMFKQGGHTDQKVKLYIPLNAPGETRETLLETTDKIDQLYAMFGRDNVFPFIFFIGIQPGTPVENFLITEGYLARGYNPLTLNPFVIKKLLYNPPPLGKLIGRAYLKALAMGNGNTADEYIGRRVMDLLAAEFRSPANKNRSQSQKLQPQFLMSEE